MDIICWNTSGADANPKGNRLHAYLPNGVANVRYLAVLSVTRIWQNSFLQSSIENYLEPKILAEMPSFQIFIDMGWICTYPDINAF